ncbi:MAG: hypothetical protein KGR98_07250, partial [Verrucomicrobia bacterium]|nr:hypothetical protein [Verrucomicrobiota bacterium]
HLRIREAARADLRNRAHEVADTLSAVMRALRFRDAVLQDRLQPVLNELVNEGTNAAQSSELLSIALLNTAGDPVVAAGAPMDFKQIVLSQKNELWRDHSVTFVNPVEGAQVTHEGVTNNVIVLPSFRHFTNRDVRYDRREGGRHDGARPGGSARTNENFGPGGAGELAPANGQPPRPEGPERRLRSRRPPWLRWMNEEDYQALVKKGEVHGLVITMSTVNYEAVCISDTWLRRLIVLFAGISAAGAALAWRNLSKTSELQIRLVRASELNSHLKEMNLAAAGLAHETRNPLNIIRGMAQMISKEPDAPHDVRERSGAIVDETDKVTAQLNEFINYSRPREVRRGRVALNSAVNEVVRTLGHDIEEKKARIETGGEVIAIEADEQLARQVLFNLLMNALQAVGQGGQVWIQTRKTGAAEGMLEIRDDGPGVAAENRSEIFKPYFTTHLKGTGLGLAVVQQIVHAHGWEIECLANEPRGAIFRIRHLKVVA